MKDQVLILEDEKVTLEIENKKLLYSPTKDKDITSNIRRN